jgi:hypothetical protein
MSKGGGRPGSRRYYGRAGDTVRGSARSALLGADRIRPPGIGSIRFLEDEALMVVFFEDKGSYWKNANAPEQDKRYQEFARFFESEPEWHDGEWIESS